MRRQHALILLLIFTIGFRLLGSYGVTDWVNFQPLAALFFCSPRLFEKNSRFSFVVPLFVWLLTWFAPAWFAAPDSSMVFNPSLFLTTLGSFGIVYGLGLMFASRSRSLFVAGSIFASIVFHLFTCSIAWLVDARYEKNAFGWWQANVSGLATDAIPSWVFLRNFMVANIVFTAFFVCVQSLVMQAQRGTKAATIL